MVEVHFMISSGFLVDPRHCEAIASPSLLNQSRNTIEYLDDKDLPWCVHGDAKSVNGSFYRVFECRLGPNFHWMEKILDTKNGKLILDQLKAGGTDMRAFSLCFEKAYHKSAYQFFQQFRGTYDIIPEHQTVGLIQNHTLLDGVLKSTNKLYQNAKLDSSNLKSVERLIYVGNETVNQCKRVYQFRNNFPPTHRGYLFLNAKLEEVLANFSQYPMKLSQGNVCLNNQTYILATSFMDDCRTEMVQWYSSTDVEAADYLYSEAQLPETMIHVANGPKGHILKENNKPTLYQIEFVDSYIF